MTSRSGSRAGVVLVLASGMLGCFGRSGPDKQSQKGGLLESLSRLAAEQEKRDAANPAARLKDPCRLVSRDEAERYLGPLAGDPFRADSSGEPKASGNVCLYRAARDGQAFRIEPDYTGGQIAWKAVTLGKQIMNTALKDDSAKVNAYHGEWDDLRWMDPGNLYVLKGDSMITIDVSGSRAGMKEATGVAAMAVTRLTAPLDYDGAAAARRAPARLVAPRDPCSLVPPAEAAAILGPLSGEPTVRSNGCVYPLARGPIVLEVTWKDGWAALNQGKATLKMFKSNMQDPIVAGAGGEKAMEKMTKDPQMAGFLNNMKGFAGKMGVAVPEVPGLPSSGPKDLSGPWDEAVSVYGLGLAVVRKDVYLTVQDSHGVGFDVTKAFLAKAASAL
jgi:hypothetical protein